MGYHGPKKGTPVIMKAGSLAVFSSRTLHHSSPNLSGDPRRVYYIAYSAIPMFNAENGEAYGHNTPFLKDAQRIDALALEEAMA